MSLKPSITFDKIHRTAIVEEHVERRTAALATTFAGLTHCRVLIAAEHWTPLHGHRYRVRIDLERGSETVVIGADSVEERVYPTLAVAIDAAFDAAENALHARAGRRDLDDGPSLPGTVTRMFRYEGFGVLQGADGDALPFHRNAVLRGAFELLEVGAAVRYVESSGDEGRHATNVDVSVRLHGPRVGGR